MPPHQQDKYRPSSLLDLASYTSRLYAMSEEDHDASTQQDQSTRTPTPDVAHTQEADTSFSQDLPPTHDTPVENNQDQKAASTMDKSENDNNDQGDQGSSSDSSQREKEATAFPALIIP